MRRVPWSAMMCSVTRSGPVAARTTSTTSSASSGRSGGEPTTRSPSGSSSATCSFLAECGGDRRRLTATAGRSWSALRLENEALSAAVVDSSRRRRTSTTSSGASSTSSPASSGSPRHVRLPAWRATGCACAPHRRSTPARSAASSSASTRAWRLGGRSTAAASSASGDGRPAHKLRPRARGGALPVDRGSAGAVAQRRRPRRHRAAHGRPTSSTRDPQRLPRRRR